MNTRYPELIGQYIPRPDGTWECLACSADSRDRGHSRGSDAHILAANLTVHTAWHEQEVGL